MTLSRVIRARTSGADVLKASSVAGKRRFKLCRFLPTHDGDIDITRLVFDSKSYAPDFFGGENGRARTGELIKHRVAARRAIEQRVSDERHGLYGGMGGTAPLNDPAQTH